MTIENILCPMENQKTMLPLLVFLIFQHGQDYLLLVFFFGILTFLVLLIIYKR